jgi:pimeloyl-ACP methyl ester carboxylesterase
MKNLYIAVLAAALAGGALESASAQSASKTSIKNVVLVHGAFADGSGWEAVAKILEKDGYTVSAAQPPETSYADDVKYARAAIDAMDGPVVLVGHSYGGSIITEAGSDPKVSALVYIAAFALDDGESCASIEQALPQASKALEFSSTVVAWARFAIMRSCCGLIDRSWVATMYQVGLVFQAGFVTLWVNESVEIGTCDMAMKWETAGGTSAAKSAAKCACSIHQLPLLSALNEEDEFISKTAQAQIKAALAKKPNATVYSYPGQRHAFSRHNGTHYNATAAALANGRTSEFLNQELR